MATPTANFQDILNGLLFRSIPWLCVQNLKFVPLPMWSPYLNVTDRRTDGQVIYDRNTALCTKVHRVAKKLQTIYLMLYKRRSKTAKIKSI